jgi:hypothetical protein
MMKSRKKIIGVVALLAGVVLFIFAKYEQHRVGDAKGAFGRGTSMFSGNAVGNSVGGYVEGRLSQYDTPLKLCEIGGLILIVLGAGVLYFACKKK